MPTFGAHPTHSSTPHPSADMRWTLPLVAINVLRFELFSPDLLNWVASFKWQSVRYAFNNSQGKKRNSKWTAEENVRLRTYLHFKKINNISTSSETCQLDPIAALRHSRHDAFQLVERFSVLSVWKLRVKDPF